MKNSLKTNSYVFLLSVALLTGAAQQTAAQPYPQRPLRLIVPYFTGGTPDLQGRALAEHLRVRLAQPVVVDNRPGAGGNIGIEAAVKSALAQGLRTADIYEPGTKKIGTQEMGDAVVAAI